METAPLPRQEVPRVSREIHHEAPFYDVQGLINDVAAGRQPANWEIFKASVTDGGANVLEKYSSDGIVRRIEDFGPWRRLSEHPLGPGEGLVKSVQRPDQRSFAPDISMVTYGENGPAASGNGNLANEFYSKAGEMFTQFPGYRVEREAPPRPQSASYQPIPEYFPMSMLSQGLEFPVFDGPTWNPMRSHRPEPGGFVPRAARRSRTEPVASYRPLTQRAGLSSQPVSRPEPTFNAGGVFNRETWSIPDSTPETAPAASVPVAELAPTRSAAARPRITEPAEELSPDDGNIHVGRVGVGVRNTWENLQAGHQYITDSNEVAAQRVSGLFTGRYKAAKEREAKEAAERKRIAQALTKIAKNVAKGSASTAGKVGMGTAKVVGAGPFVVGALAAEGVRKGTGKAIASNQEAARRMHGKLATNDYRAAERQRIAKNISDLASALRRNTNKAVKDFNASRQAGLEATRAQGSMPTVGGGTTFEVGNLPQEEVDAMDLGRIRSHNLEWYRDNQTRDAINSIVPGIKRVASAGNRAAKGAVDRGSNAFRNAQAREAEVQAQRSRVVHAAAGKLASVGGNVARGVQGGAQRGLDSFASSVHSNFLDNNPDSNIDPWAAMGRTVLPHGGEGFANRSAEDYRHSSALSGEVIDEGTAEHGAARAAIHVGDDRDPDFGKAPWERSDWRGPVSTDATAVVAASPAPANNNIAVSSELAYTMSGFSSLKPEAPHANGNGKVGREKPSSQVAQADHISNLVESLYGDEPIDYSGGRDRKGRFVRTKDGLNKAITKEEEGRTFSLRSNKEARSIQPSVVDKFEIPKQLVGLVDDIYANELPGRYGEDLSKALPEIKEYIKTRAKKYKLNIPEETLNELLEMVDVKELNSVKATA